MHCVVLVPFYGHSSPVDALRLETAETALGITWHPVIEFLLIFLHPFVFLELYDFFGDEIVCLG